eukprot:3455643-Ditylum_brightwellii.AAC.1
MYKDKLKDSKNKEEEASVGKEQKENVVTNKGSNNNSEENDKEEKDVYNDTLMAEYTAVQQIVLPKSYACVGNAVFWLPTRRCLKDGPIVIHPSNAAGTQQMFAS